MSHQDIMCEVEISDTVEVGDSDFHGIDVAYGDYDVADEYEEVTCEAEDSQGLLMQGMDDRKYQAVHILSQPIDLNSTNSLRSLSFQSLSLPPFFHLPL